MDQPDEEDVHDAAVSTAHVSEPERAIRAAGLGLVLGLVLRLVARR